jgi:hypothetical protein
LALQRSRRSGRGSHYFHGSKEIPFAYSAILVKVKNRVEELVSKFQGSVQKPLCAVAIHPVVDELATLEVVILFLQLFQNELREPPIFLLQEFFELLLVKPI